MAPAPIAVSHGDGFSHEQLKSQNEYTHSVRLPLESNSALDSFDYNDLTPCIGREFPNANLVDMMNSPGSDALLAELALTSVYPSDLEAV